MISDITLQKKLMRTIDILLEFYKARMNNLKELVVNSLQKKLFDFKSGLFGLAKIMFIKFFHLFAILVFHMKLNFKNFIKKYDFLKKISK